MSTLAEIEDAVERLSLPEQQALLMHLQSRLAATNGSVGDREAWLRRLAELRERVKPGGASIQQMMDELRGERF